MTNDFRLIDGVLTIAPGTRYIKSQQFSENPHIRRLIIPEGVGFLEDEAFAECENLREVILPEGLINISVAAFASCVSLQSINIPSTVRSIEDGAFLFCASLQSVELPEGLEQIADLAFQGSGLESVVVPASVRRIGEEAFFECERLRHADVLGEHTRICLNAFGGNDNLISGYIAPGYPDENSGPAELLYALLWCSCPERHKTETGLRAETFIRAQEDLIMEWVLKTNNVPAMTGLSRRKLLSADCIERSLRETLRSGQTELSALLLRSGSAGAAFEEEFEL